MARGPGLDWDWSGFCSAYGCACTCRRMHKHVSRVLHHLLYYYGYTFSCVAQISTSSFPL